MTAVTGLDGDVVRQGARFRIAQPGLAKLVWRVTEVRQGESFTWEASSPGVRTVAYHRVTRNPDGTTQIAIGIHQTGVLAGLVRMLTGTKTRRYLTLEAAGLKTAAESTANPA